MARFSCSAARARSSRPLVMARRAFSSQLAASACTCSRRLAAAALRSANTLRGGTAHLHQGILHFLDDQAHHLFRVLGLESSMALRLELMMSVMRENIPMLCLLLRVRIRECDRRNHRGGMSAITTGELDNCHCDLQ